MIGKKYHALIVLLLVACSRQPEVGQPELLLEPGSERQVAYTDKGDAFWVTRSGGYNSSPWHGLTASKRQYFEDLFIYADGHLLPRELAEVTVDPVQMVREYPDLGIRESWTLVDHSRSLLVVLEADTDTRWTLQPAVPGGDGAEDFEISEHPQVLNVKLKRLADLPASYSYVNLQFSRSVEWQLPVSPEKPLYNAYLTPQATCSQSRTLAVLISVDSVATAILPSPKLVKQVQNDRRTRIKSLLETSRMESDQADVDAAIAWAHTSLDALIMDQKGIGIYAGLPWFDEYWGRDEFISFTGAVLVSGKFSTARQILMSFAQLQNTDPLDPNYGRVPNRAQPEDIIYNTTDGTPWFVRSVWDYYRYSGDEAFLRTMWPAIRLAAVGALQNWTDDSGLLRHADADTWMDAKGPEGPWSPRGDRAIEIQFLWRDQLEITEHLAYKYAVDDLGDECQETRMKLERGLTRFRDPLSGALVDHLNADGSQDKQIRPNVFLVPPLFQETCDWQTFQQMAPRLVSADGVLSLSQDDQNFHPYHQLPGLYVQDAAYHNGIIWTWNSAATISTAIHFAQYHYAERLFDGLTDQLLQRGAIGTLSELTDSWPWEGSLRLSGTFSQGWSLAEYLRSFYQDILGVQPDLAQQQMTLAPRLLSGMQRVDFSHPFGLDHWNIHYEENDQSFIIQLQRDSTQAVTLACELLVDDQVCRISMPWAKRSLVLRFEKQMGQWTVPASVADYEQSRSMVELPINGLAFCAIDTSLAVPALAGPDHPLLEAGQVLPGKGTVRPLLTLRDAAGDDKGPNGQYVYPANPQFGAGSVDILAFSMGEQGEDYHFQIHFTDLVDPGWHPESGYQLTYCAVGFDHDPQRGTQLVGMNSQARFKGDFKADEILYISGGLRLVDAKTQIIAEYIPLSVSDAIGSAETETIQFKLPKYLFNGDLTAAKVQIAVGFQDDHGGAGLGDFRAVRTKNSEWLGGGKTDPLASNVYDWLLASH